MQTTLKKRRASYTNAVIIRLSYIAVAGLSLSFCNSSSLNDIKMSKVSEPASKNEATASFSPFSFSYDLGNPDEKYLMPDYLEEISGLSYYRDDRILCVQDEKANIYVLDLQNRGIIEKYSFGKEGDYEDIAFSENTAWVIRSDGNIYGIENFDTENRLITEYNTPLSSKNDTEGLVYDRKTNSLLIACKASPSIEKNNEFKGYKALYRFSLDDKKLVRDPEILINLSKSETYKDKITFENFSREFHNPKKATDFQPSGIAVHPVSGEIYVISNTAGLLIVLDRTGKVTKFGNLNNKLFIQPEGICFSPAGDLFISNEGKGGKGYILRFNQRL